MLRALLYATYNVHRDTCGGLLYPTTGHGIYSYSELSPPLRRVAACIVDSRQRRWLYS